MSLRKILQRFLRRNGYDVRWIPRALAERPESRLEPTLAAAIAQRYLAVPDFSYVQVGAFDGVCVDPLAGIVEGLDARALLIEPHPDAFARLAQNTAHRRNVELLQVAVSDQEGELPFFSLDPAAPGAPSKAPLISSLDRAMLLRELDPTVDWSPWVRVTRVRSTTLNTILAERRMARLDLLQIDAEGYDGRILRALDFARWKPGIINFEHTLLPPRRSRGMLAPAHRARLPPARRAARHARGAF